MATLLQNAEKLADSRIDCHVHTFTSALEFSPARRYQPDYDASAKSLMDMLVAHGVGKALLVQPSFLGTDNTYLADAIGLYPEHFRGVAVVDPSIDVAMAKSLARRGIVGVRLNAIGRPTPDLGSALYRGFTRTLAEAGLFLEIQAELEQWGTMARHLPQLTCDVVIDHFGRTPPGHDSMGFEILLESALKRDVWFKFSGPYRFGHAAAARCAKILIETIGTDHIVWGSDWPWTQFESAHTYADCLAWLSDWVTEERVHDILVRNPKKLLRL
ncbi:amidohydrolase family protein [Rhizobium sp. 1AS11]|uniref:amidohydrolase family protein n=1 Tax=Rhizobium acaciae TaxID=2989736 RepID=UPI0022236C51|nr:amidohydrolase family protein [Rhizobium acaciae]MCW1743346.1 amidohydrolase family protein [Rhizobium acaciae]